MKKNALIVCEYNPFHSGHKHHIEQTRLAGAENIICLMSGNFVQRGELAFCEKAIRAKAAVRCGADLVLELPLPFVLSGARYFAQGAARTAAALGLDATLSFGAGGTKAQLFALRDAVCDPAAAAEVSSLCETAHYSYPRAMQAALERRLSADLCALLREPNSLLALEYLIAFRVQAPDVDFFALPRDACGHDAQAPAGAFASAKYLRELFYLQPPAQALAAAAPYLPAPSRETLAGALAQGKLPLRRDVFSAVAMTRLLSLDAERLKQTNGVRQGLENRILTAVKTQNDLFALYDAVKSKRYTHAGVRQAVLSAALGITRGDLEGDPPYLRVLGMSARGREILRERKGKTACPFVMNLSEAPDCRLRVLDETAGKLAALCRPRKGTDAEYQVKPFVAE